MSLTKHSTALTFSSAILLASLAQPAFAARTDNQQAALEASTITTTAIAGAAAGGPVGFIAGGLIGMFLSHETRQGNQAEIDLVKAEESMDALAENIIALNTEVAVKERTIASLEQKTLDRLALQVLFGTGEDTLNEQDLARVEILAEHLRINGDLQINLSGHSDPRGTDEYNNLLSMERAKAVESALIEYGVPKERIITNAHGASFSTAQTGHYEQYARDRRVEIEITNTRNQRPVATLQK